MDFELPPHHELAKAEVHRPVDPNGIGRAGPTILDGGTREQQDRYRGGTGEVQRNIVAERVLGRPHDVDAHQGLSWSDAQEVGAR